MLLSNRVVKSSFVFLMLTMITSANASVIGALAKGLTHIFDDTAEVVSKSADDVTRQLNKGDEAASLKIAKEQHLSSAEGLVPIKVPDVDLDLVYDFQKNLINKHRVNDNAFLKRWLIYDLARMPATLQRISNQHKNDNEGDEVRLNEKGLVSVSVLIASMLNEVVNEKDEEEKAINYADWMRAVVNSGELSSFDAGFKRVDLSKEIPVEERVHAFSYYGLYEVLVKSPNIGKRAKALNDYAKYIWSENQTAYSRVQLCSSLSHETVHGNLNPLPLTKAFYREYCIGGSFKSMIRRLTNGEKPDDPLVTMFGNVFALSGISMFGDSYEEFATASQDVLVSFDQLSKETLSVDAKSSVDVLEDMLLLTLAFGELNFENYSNGVILLNKFAERQMEKDDPDAKRLGINMLLYGLSSAAGNTGNINALAQIISMQRVTALTSSEFYMPATSKEQLIHSLLFLNKLLPKKSF